MQSFLQYRRIGSMVRIQIERDQEKAAFHMNDRTEFPPPIHQTAATSSSSLSDIASELEQTGAISNVRTHQSVRTALGYALGGIHARDRTTHEGKGEKVFVVKWDGEDDPSNPRNWSVSYRVCVTLIVACMSFTVGAASSADTAVLPQAAADLGVSDVVESLALGIYLVGYAIGAVFAGAFSEIFGRNPVYLSTMILFMAFIMASALAPNIGAQLAFRFFAGAFGAAPLTCAGGSVSDLWPSLEKNFGFPIYAIVGFCGVVLGPVICSYIINLGSWRWAEWIILIMSALVLAIIILFQPETFHPVLLKWKAEQIRSETGDHRYRSEMEIVQTSLGARLKIALIRPLVLAIEPIVLFMTLYMTALYIVVFTFLDGYPLIFQDVYGISQGLTNVIFTGIMVGILLASFLVPFVYKMTKERFERNKFVPEIRLWFAMMGAPALPISLFWMGWTDYVTISIWSPIMASVLLGFGVICIFLSAYMYIIDAYEVYAASALAFVTFARYFVAGGMTVVGVPFYKNMGPHWTLAILGGINILMVPIPYIFYKYGHRIRLRSSNAVSWD